MLVIGHIYKTELWFLTQGACPLDKEVLPYLPQSFQPLLPSCLEGILFTPATLNGGQLVPCWLGLVTTVGLQGRRALPSRLSCKHRARPRVPALSDRQLTDTMAASQYQRLQHRDFWFKKKKKQLASEHITKAHTSSLKDCHFTFSSHPSPLHLLQRSHWSLISLAVTPGHVLFYLTSSRIIFHV